MKLLKPKNAKTEEFTCTRVVVKNTRVRIMRGLLFLVHCAAAAVYDLSEDNFDRLVFRKSNSAAFIKFFSTHSLGAEERYVGPAPAD